MLIMLKVVWTFIKEALTFILKNWKYFLVGAVCLFLAYQFQQFRINNLKADLREVKAEVTKLKEANMANMTTIGFLKEDVKKANNSCAKRLLSKDELIRELQRIDAINNGDNSVTTGVNSNSPLLIEFGKLFLGEPK